MIYRDPGELDIDQEEPGKVFASYKRSKDMPDYTPPAPTEFGTRFTADSLHATAQVVEEGAEDEGGENTVLGSIFIQSDLEPVLTRTKNYLGIALAVMAGSTLVSLVISMFLQRFISRPLVDLSATAELVSSSKDYSHRAPETGRKDELGVLIRSFNGMLGQIQLRDDKLHEVNEELALSEQKAQAATDAKSAFVANMSHELRTPLNAIIGFSDVLLSEIEEESVLSDLRVVNASGKHLLNLINDILDLSKIEAGKMELFLEPYDVATLAEEVLGTVQPLLDNNGNTMRKEIDHGLGKLQIDVTKLRQCLFNLLSNANKFTDQGELSLTVGREERDQNWLRIEVADTGIGMSPEQLSKLFRPFTQADASTSRKYGGTGLGLIISKTFCEMMGGGITVQSELGKGSTFTIRLPLSVEAEADVEQAVSEVMDALPELDADRNTVLVIDDDPRVHDLLSRYLRDDGWNIVTASNGTEGLRLAEHV
ncbi:MAG: ATP-binding protein, partial [Planctomycetales bacterium]